MEEEQYYGLEVECQKKLLASFCFLVEGTWKFHVPSTSEKCFEFLKLVVSLSLKNPIC